MAFSSSEAHMHRDRVIYGSGDSKRTYRDQAETKRSTSESDSNSKIIKGKKKQLKLGAICAALHHPDDLSLMGGGFGVPRARRPVIDGWVWAIHSDDVRNKPKPMGLADTPRGWETKGVPTAGSPRGKGEPKQKHTAKNLDCVEKWWKQRPDEGVLTTTNCGGGEKKRGKEVRLVEVVEMPEIRGEYLRWKASGCRWV